MDDLGLRGKSVGRSMQVPTNRNRARDVERAEYEKRREQVNPKCLKCQYGCKQSALAKVIRCPKH